MMKVKNAQGKISHIHGNYMITKESNYYVIRKFQPTNEYAWEIKWTTKTLKEAKAYVTAKHVSAGVSESFQALMNHLNPEEDE